MVDSVATASNIHTYLITTNDCNITLTHPMEMQPLQFIQKQAMFRLLY